MRFPRSVKPFRGQLELAPFLSVFFLLAILLLFGSSLVFTPGIPLHLPESVELRAHRIRPFRSLSMRTARFISKIRSATKRGCERSFRRRRTEQRAPDIGHSGGQRSEAWRHGSISVIGPFGRLEDVLIATRPPTIPLAAGRSL